MTAADATPAVRRPTVQRADIEGLRAVAVGVVLTSHLIGQPAGGFVGVDVFFVISGFLITGLLLREYTRTGRISFREFYARRIRRIMPAALVTLLFTCLAARLVFFDSRASQTYEDTVWAALSVANWHLAANGTDYFQSTLPPSIVQQYWSLSVEEQFYLVWPVLIVVVGALSIRRGERVFRWALGVALGLVVIVSFAWAMWQTPRDTTVAYFSTFTRGWELGIGGLLAMATGRLARMPRWLSLMLVWAGLAAIAISTVVTRSDNTFPAPGGLPATLGTVALIAGGTAAVAVYNPILENPVSRYIGKISYSLYLWHWPVIIISESLLPKGSALQIGTAVVASFALASISFYAVEQPIRDTTFMSKLAPGKRPRALSERARRGYSMALAGAAVLALAWAAVPERVAGAEAQPIWPTAGTASGAPPAAPGQTPSDLSQQIDAAVSATAWPNLNPSLDKLSRSRAAEWSACGNVDADNESKCRFGNGTDPKKRVAILGDSIAISWIPAVRAGFETKGWTVHGLTFGECPAARIDVVSSSRDEGFTENCRKHQQFALARAKALKPAIVIISTTNGTLTRVVGAQGAAAASALQQAEAAAIKSLASKDTKVVVLAPPPNRQDMVTCATRVSVPADCLSDIAPSWNTLRTLEEGAAREAGGVYVDTQSWTCTPAGQCPAFIGTTPVMADGVHLTNAMSRRLGTALYDSTTAKP